MTQWDVTIDSILDRGPYDRAVWDFDGVVADTEPLQGHAYGIILDRLGVDHTDLGFERYVGTTESEIWASIRSRYHIDKPIAELRAERMKVFLGDALANLRPSWFVPDVMNRLAQQGTEQVIVSSGNREVIEELLRAWGLRAWISKIASSDANNVESYSKLAEMERALSEARRAILFEDHPRFLALGISLGVVTVGVTHVLNDLTDLAVDFVLPVSKA